MPITLHDLTPILTPYQRPEALDLSGVANQISHNNDRTQARALADQNLAQQQAELAHKERQGLLANSQNTVDPLAQRAYEAQLPGAGLGVMSGMDYFSAPETQLEAPAGLDAPQAAPPGLEMPGLDMGGGYQPVDLSFQQKGGIVDAKTGQTVADYDPGMARQRERDALQQQLHARTRGASNISQPAAAQGEAMAEGALLANGYDSGKAMTALNEKVINPEMQQANANWRAQNQAIASSERHATGAGFQQANYYRGVKREFAALHNTKPRNDMLGAAARIESLADSKDPMANQVALGQLVRQLSGAAASEREGAAIKQSAGKLVELQRQIDSWVNGGAMPPQLMQSLKNTMRTIQVALMKERAATAKAFAAQVARDRVLGEGYKDQAYRDLIDYTGEGDEVPGMAPGEGGGSSDSSSTSASAGGGAPIPGYIDPATVVLDQ